MKPSSCFSHVVVTVVTLVTVAFWIEFHGTCWMAWQLAWQFLCIMLSHTPEIKESSKVIIQPKLQPRHFSTFEFVWFVSCAITKPFWLDVLATDDSGETVFEILSYEVDESVDSDFVDAPINIFKNMVFNRLKQVMDSKVEELKEERSCVLQECAESKHCVFPPEIIDKTLSFNRPDLTLPLVDAANTPVAWQDNEQAILHRHAINAQLTQLINYHHFLFIFILLCLSTIFYFWIMIYDLFCFSWSTIMEGIGLRRSIPASFKSIHF